MTATIIHGNNLDILPTFDDCSIDAIVTDPPYELGFMGKRWDASGIAYNITLWQECLRVLKPGGHLLAFGGTRTYHRMACAIEDAGFEIRDSIHWLYGSGFPKSLDVSKAIDKAGGVSPARQAEVLRVARDRAGLSREEVAATVGCTPSSVRDWEEGRTRTSGAAVEFITPSDDYRDKLANLLGYTADERQIVGVSAVRAGDGSTYGLGHSGQLTKGGSTDAARQWAGWGTALKPAHEPIVVARKPLIGTVAANVLEWGTGAINIDASRIAGAPWTPVAPNAGGRSGGVMGKHTEHPGGEPHSAGRWPANVILTHTDTCDDECVPGCPVALLDEQSGVSRSGKPRKDRGSGGIWADGNGVPVGPQYGDSGGASRFFYCAKPSRKERNAGLDQPSTHPTVKPLALMRYLVRLVTPPNGTVLDPFAGSGTTLMAAILEGFNPIGIEMTDEYLPIIQGRIAWAEQQATNTSDQQELDL